MNGLYLNLYKSSRIVYGVGLCTLPAKPIQSVSNVRIYDDYFSV